MQGRFEETQSKWIKDSPLNQYCDIHGSGANTTEDEGSEDESQEYVVFEGKSQQKFFGLPDIDLMDYPISCSYVALPNYMKLSTQKNSRLLVKKFEASTLIRKQCGFCQQKLILNCKVVQLPCKHLLHYSCVQKWKLITHPCRKCDN